MEKFPYCRLTCSLCFQPKNAKEEDKLLKMIFLNLLKKN